MTNPTVGRTLFSSPFFRVLLIVGLLLTGHRSACAQALPAAGFLEETPVQTSEPPDYFKIQRDFRFFVKVPDNVPWVLERNLFLSPSDPFAAGQVWRPWFPVLHGFGGAASPSPNAAMLQSAFFNGASTTTREARFLLHRWFSVVPPPTPYVPGSGPRVHFRYTHVNFKWQPSGITARWLSVDPAFAAAPPERVAVFPTGTGLHLSNPHTSQANANANPAGVGIFTGPRTDSPPVALSFSVFSPGPTAPLPTASTLTAPDAALRQFILDHQTEIRAELWPLYFYGAQEPPSPVTTEIRSFFRLRARPAAVAVNGYGLPSALAALNKLVISEVCYLGSPDLVDERSTPLPAGAPPIHFDPLGARIAGWAELCNASAVSVDLDGYYVTAKPDSPANRLLADTAAKRFRLPPFLLPAGQSAIVYFTEKGKAEIERLAVVQSTPSASLDDRYPFTAAFDLKESGEKVFLYTTAWTLVDSLDPPPGSTTFPTGPHAGVSFGRAIENGLIAFRWFLNPSPGVMNDRAVFTTALTEPETRDPVGNLLPGQVFTTGPLTVRLTHPDAAATLVYTLNGAEPDAASAIYDPAQPLELHSSTIVRCRSFAPGRLGSRSITRTFIHLPSVFVQRFTDEARTPVCNPEITAQWLHTAPPMLGGYAAPDLRAQLVSRPIVALTFPSWPLEGQPITIGETPETPAVFEFIDPSRPASYGQSNSAASLAGNHNTGKRSWHIVFKKSAGGSGNWAGPVLPGGYSGVFPDSLVTSFSRLLIRSGSSNSWGDREPSTNPGTSDYIADAYLKETQRALGGLVPARRYVHVFLNARYWGLYDLEEHIDEDMISSRLISQNPAFTQAEKDARAPENVLFYNPNDAVKDPAALAAWDGTFAQSVPINFSDFSGAPDEVTPKGPLGWQFWKLGNAAPLEADDDDGVQFPSGTNVIATWSSTNLATRPLGEFSEDERLAGRYLNDAVQNLNVAVTGIRYPYYVVFGLLACDNGSSATYTTRDFAVNGVPVLGGGGTATAYAAPSACRAATGEPWKRVTTSTIGNYWISSIQSANPVTGSTVTITAPPRNGTQRSTLAAVVIQQVAGPSANLNDLRNLDYPSGVLGTAKAVFRKRAAADRAAQFLFCKSVG